MTFYFSQFSEVTCLLGTISLHFSFLRDFGTCSCVHPVTHLLTYLLHLDAFCKILRPLTFVQLHSVQDQFTFCFHTNQFHELCSLNICVSRFSLPFFREEAWRELDQYVDRWRQKLNGEETEEIEASPEVDWDKLRTITHYPDVTGGTIPSGSGFGTGQTPGGSSSNSSGSDTEGPGHVPGTYPYPGTGTGTSPAGNPGSPVDWDTINREKTEKLKGEISELNKKYQSQLTRNNELQELLKTERDKVVALETKMHKIADGKASNGLSSNGLSSNGLSSNGLKSNESGSGNVSGTDSGSGSKGNSFGFGGKLDLKKKLEEKLKKNKTDKKSESPNITKSDDQKETKSDNQHNGLPSLSAEDEALVAKYKKNLKMMLPAPAVKHKMKKEKNERLIPYVFPQEAAKLLKLQEESSETALPPLNEEDQKLMAKYQKSLKMGLPPPAIKHKMKKEKNERLIPYMFPDENKSKKKKKKRVLPKDVKDKPDITPAVPMMPFHWTKVSERKMGKTIWHEVYKKYGGGRDVILEENMLGELFGKKEEIKSTKKGRKARKKEDAPTVKLIERARGCGDVI